MRPSWRAATSGFCMAEPYLGTRQHLVNAPNDEIKLRVAVGCDLGRRRRHGLQGSGQDRFRKVIDSACLFSDSLETRQKPSTIAKKILDLLAPFRLYRMFTLTF
jgi:hypothetical protein